MSRMHRVLDTQRPLERRRRGYNVMHKYIGVLPYSVVQRLVALYENPPTKWYEL